MDMLRIGGLDLPVRRCDTLVVGSGCAALNAADCLYSLGRRDVLVITEGVGGGTSRNAGSDKQTYYKLSLAAGEPDSVGALAATLAGGMGVHGDTALAEAAGSVKAFIKLALLGVPFPTNAYGEYIGYKTDHDPRRRATSAGPLTSRYMAQCLESAVRAKGIPIIDRMMAVRLITHAGRVYGLLALDVSATAGAQPRFVLFACAHIILATGGPAAVYANSVYPTSQRGMTGMALEAGVPGANLQIWQYGLASTALRWNLSGTYQQVLPRYIARSSDGAEREFLHDYIRDPFDALNRVFLKGYQWPFDTAKLGGSSLVDMLVHHETAVLGNRVFLDYTRNPACLDEAGFARLPAQARSYLTRSGALGGTPVERLAIMNQPAIELYRSQGIDLYTQPLEIAVCAQHHNGGLAVDAHWRCGIDGLYAAGEAAGTFGVYRPGGSALNSTQVGAMRAAEHIAAAPQDVPDASAFAHTAQTCLHHFLAQCTALHGKPALPIAPLLADSQRLMSRCAAHIRDTQAMCRAQKTLQERLAAVFTHRPQEVDGLALLLQYRDTLITQLAILSAMLVSADICGSRGCALVLSPKGEPLAGLPQTYRFAPLRDGMTDQVMHTVGNEARFDSQFQPVRPMPASDDWFETVWNAYRCGQAGNVYTEEEGT